MAQAGELLFIPLIDSDDETRQIREELFTRELLEWAGNRASKYGDYIVPKIICLDTVDEPHKVAWVEHNRTHPDSRQIIQNHHIVCECVLCRDFNDGRGGIDTSLCVSMERVLEARARIVGADFQADISICSGYEAQNMMTGSGFSEIERRDFDFESLSVAAIEQVLHMDQMAPETWNGNVISGALPIDQASRIIDQPLSSTYKYAVLLHKSRRVSFDGENLRLAA